VTDPYLDWDGAYVLGALDADERREFESHLADCDACRARVAELAGLPAALRDLTPEVAERIERVPALPDTVLPRLARRVTRARRRVLAASVAAAAAVLAVLAVVLLPGSVGQERVELALAADEPTHLSADVTLVALDWGTRIETHCTYELGMTGYGDTEYAMYVTDTDGNAEEVASWTAGPGSDVRPTATTRLAVDDIASVDIRTMSTGAVVLAGAP
jgi:hypothetical protein